MPLLSDFQAALFDIDGTLTTTGREVRPATRQALKLLGQKGIVGGFCTGKPYGKLLQENLMSVLPESSIHIVSGGFQIIASNGRVLWQTTFPVKTIKLILEMATNSATPCFIKHSFFVYGNQAMFAYADQKNKGVREILKPISPEAFIDPLAISLINPSEAVMQKVATIPGITLNHNLANHAHYVDIAKEGQSKATGIHQWSKITDIPENKIIGFGDSQNDIDFLKTVGFAVALGNATDDIKALAHRVIGHTDEDGLATYLQEVCKTGEL